MRHVLRLAVVAALVGVLAAGAAASPQPQPLCPVCTQEVLEGNGGEGLPVAHSAATVRLRPDGTADWTVRNRLSDDGAAATARNSTDALRAEARTALTESRGSATVTAVRNLSVSVDGRTVVYRFETGGVARRSAGTLLVDHLHTGGRSYFHTVRADRFTVVGPPGTDLLNDPASGTVDGRRVTWTDGSDPADTYLVYGAAGPEGTARSTVARALATAPAVRANLWWVTAVAVLAVGPFGAAGFAARRRREGAGDSATTLGIVGAGGVVAGLLFGVADADAAAPVVGPAAAYLAAGVGLRVEAGRDHPVAVPALAAAVGAVLSWALALPAPLAVGLAAAVVGAGVPLGASLEDRPVVAGATVLAMATVYALAVGVGDGLTTRPGALQVFVLPVGLLGAVVAATLAVPLVRLGRRRN